MAGVGQIERLDPPRYQQARAALGRAFFDYPLMVYALANDRRRAPAVTQLYGAILWDTFRWGEVHVTPDIAAVCAWLPPEKSMPTFWRQARAGMLQLPFRFGLAGFRKLVAYDVDKIVRNAKASALRIRTAAGGRLAPAGAR